MKPSGAAAFSISDNGRLVYALGEGGGGLQRSFVWVDRDGREEPVLAAPADYGEFNLSPDGTRVAVSIRGDDPAVWIYDLTRNTPTRLTFESDNPLARGPTWTPDGARVAFGSPLAWKRADGTGDVETLGDGSGRFPLAFSPDETTLVFGGGRNAGLRTLTLEGDRTSTVLLDDDFDERNATLSPDGRWLAYTSNETGQREVYVRPFPDLEAGTKWRISTDGGAWPLWNPAGDELFYSGPTGLMAQEFEADPAFTPTALTQVFEREFVVARNREMAVSPDGRRFLLLTNYAAGTATENTEPLQINVVLNWHQELLERVPIQ